MKDTGLDNFWLALSFLTTLPARQVPYRPDGLGKAALFFPFIGFILGGALALLAWAGDERLPALVLAVILVALWAILTGGLHLDGFADCCDGLLAPAKAQRRITIMHDSRSGAFAVIGLVLILMLKVVLVAELLDQEDWLPGLLLVPVVARWLLLLAGRQPLAREEGLAAGFQAGLTTERMLLAIILPLLLLAWSGLKAWLALVLALLATGLWLRLARKRIGGVSGDVLGAVVESAEVALLLGLLL